MTVVVVVVVDEEEQVVVSVTLAVGMAIWLEIARVLDVLAAVVEEVVGLVIHAVHKDTWLETVPVVVVVILGDLGVVVEEASVTTVERRATLLENALANP